MQFLERLWKTWENKEILNLSQQKREKTILVRTNLSYYEVFYTRSISNRNKKKQILMNKPVYLGISKFWYDYIKPKYGEKEIYCYMDAESFIVSLKTDDVYKDIIENVKTRFDTSNYKLDRPLPKEKNKKVIGSMKDELAAK